LTCLDDKCIIYFEPIHNRLACLGPEKGGKRDALPEKNQRIVVVGSANMDIVISVDRLPRGGETIPGGAMALFPGGKGANQACAAAKLAGGACLIAQVGNDRFGEALLASIEEAGVDTALIGASARASGCASIYVLPDGQNSIVISAGANATLDPTTALSRLETLGSPGFVLSQLEIPVETVEAVLTWARAHGAVTILDPAPARPLPPSLLGTIDFLTPNQSEAATLLGKPCWEIRSFADAQQAARGLLAMGPSAVVIKLGALGCVVATGGMCSSVEGFRVEVVDTTAAGDAFNGAFAVALADGKPLLEAAAFANAAGAVSVTRNGAQASLPAREELERFIKQAVAVCVDA
jgi:ribokinase